MEEGCQPSEVSQVQQLSPEQQQHSMHPPAPSVCPAGCSAALRVREQLMAHGHASTGLSVPQFRQLKELRADISTRASTALITHI